jgi:hypothetical protein
MALGMSSQQNDVSKVCSSKTGTAPLAAAALGDLYKLLGAQAGPDSKPEVGGMPGFWSVCFFVLW